MVKEEPTDDRFHGSAPSCEKTDTGTPATKSKQKIQKVSKNRHFPLAKRGALR
jgi:hypothetical protein